MNAGNKSENRAATRFNAKQSTDTADSTAEKAATLLIAAMAMKGHDVARLPDGGFLICRWGLTKHCWSLAELENFAQQIGVRQ